MLSFNPSGGRTIFQAVRFYVESVTRTVSIPQVGERSFKHLIAMQRLQDLQVSIPQVGERSFKQDPFMVPLREIMVSIPQVGERSFKHSGICRMIFNNNVSIPQVGERSFKPLIILPPWSRRAFQSLRWENDLSSTDRK